jgi:hypothetical protein
MSKKDYKIWESESSSDESSEEIYKSFFKSDFFINKKSNKEAQYLNKKSNREDENHSIGPRIKFESDRDKKFNSDKEAQMYAQLVQQGKRCLVRGGQIGLSNEEIERYESLGYVMSGERHKKTFQPIKVKKEGQTYTAEEKRALAIYNLEEQQRRERNIINEMKYMWQNKKIEEDDKH